jgi:hypothetical protein
MSFNLASCAHYTLMDCSLIVDHPPTPPKTTPLKLLRHFQTSQEKKGRQPQKNGRQPKKKGRRPQFFLYMADTLITIFKKSTLFGCDIIVN